MLSNFNISKTDSFIFICDNEVLYFLMFRFFQSNQYFLINVWLHLYSYAKTEFHKHFF